MQESSRRSIVSIFAGNAATTSIAAIQAVVLFPLFLDLVGARVYGAWLGSGEVLLWLQALDLGLPNLLIQRIGAANGRKEPGEASEYFTGGLLVLGAVAGLAFVGGWSVAPFVPLWMGLTGSEAAELVGPFRVGVATTAIVILNNTVVGLSRGVQRTTLLNAILVGASLVGFGVTLIGLLCGWRLWAAAAGMGARTMIIAAGSVLFVTRLRRILPMCFHTSGRVVRELLKTSPVTAAAGIGYALMNQSEVALVAFLLRPELAAVLAATRKAADLGKAIVDIVGTATYGSFAHLVASESRSQAQVSFDRIVAFRTGMAVVLAAGYLAVNRGLVTVWVGQNQYGGFALSIAMAMQLIVVGNGYLMNYLYRATGSVVRGSLLLIVEAMTRVPIMVALVLVLGLPGVALAGILTSAFGGIAAHRGVRRAVAGSVEPTRPSRLAVWGGRSIILMLGVGVGQGVELAGWAEVLAVAASIGIVGVIVLLLSDVRLRSMVFPRSAMQVPVSENNSSIHVG